MRPGPAALLAAAVVGAVLAGSCSKSGTYEVSWNFAPPPLDTRPEDPASACSAHGVFGVRVVGLAADGAGEDISTACTRGRLSHTVAPGTWTFTLHALDARGRDKLAEDPEGGVGPVLNPRLDPVVIEEDQTVALPTVTFVPLPACGDGVDNDGDGRVDRDDPDCTSDQVTSECGAEADGGVPCPLR